LIFTYFQRKEVHYVKPPIEIMMTGASRGVFSEDDLQSPWRMATIDIQRVSGQNGSLMAWPARTRERFLMSPQGRDHTLKRRRRL
jgi:hypothetical protein